MPQLSHFSIILCSPNQVLETTSGDALVYGESIRNERGLSAIRSIMGVCPQFDILWDNLSAREHLRLYASIKGIPWHKRDKEVDGILSQVQHPYYLSDVELIHQIQKYSSLWMLEKSNLEHI